MARAHPAAPAALAALGAAALEACSSAPAVECPGTALAQLSFAAARAAAGDAGVAPLDPVPDLPDCGASVGAFPAALGGFQATLAYDAGSGVAALCRQPPNEVLYGTRAGTRFSLDATTDGAVLAGCAAACNAVLSAVVVGDATLDPGGAVTAFDGALFEVFTPVAASECGSCFAAPPGACVARYVLHGS